MKKIIIIILVTGLPIALITGFILLNSEPDKFSEKEKEGAIDQILGRRANLDPEIKTGSTIYKSEYVEFSYPAEAIKYEYKDPSLENNENILDSFSFDIKSPRLILNYNAAKTSEPKLEDIPAIKFRLDKSNGYLSKAENVDGVEGVSFSKDRSGEYMAERTLFVINNGYLFTISITGSSLEDVEKLSNQIIGTIVFK